MLPILMPMDTPPSSESGKGNAKAEEHEVSHETPNKTYRRLCDRCWQHGFSYSSFVISDDDPRTHYDASKHKLPSSLRTGGPDIKLQPFEEILKHGKTCKFCVLVLRALHKYTPHVLEQSSHIRLSMRWEVDGHQEVSSNTFRKRTRRLRLTWEAGGDTFEAFFVLLASGDLQASNSDMNAYRSRSHTHRGREVKPEDGKQALIKGWLDICKTQHKNSCGIATQIGEFQRLVNETYFGVIDVTDLRLKPLPTSRSGKPAKFVALSYVWGAKKPGDMPYVTTRQNVPYRRAHGGLEKELKKLPSVIRDAIELVQQMHIRYLWIDAICIVQDSPVSFRLNAENMHTIYGNAHFTICAADDKDAHAGLKAMHTDLEPMSSSNDIEQITSNLRLQIARPPEMMIKDSVWNSRGWTFQERIMSRRCVIFSGGQVFYQCRKTAFSEGVHNDAKGSGWSLQAMGAPSRYFIEIEQRSFAFYMRSVPTYYRRNLTQAADILLAYKGLQSIMQLVMSAEFCWGLPTSHFDLALLWQPTKPMKRRVAAVGTHQTDCTSLIGKKCNCDPVGRLDLGSVEFPSWSWCGWIEGEVEYDADVLHGALLQVCGWLCRHTWIRWHILNGMGQLRPLWSRRHTSWDSSRELRWRGYLGTIPTPPDDVPMYSDSSTDVDDIYTDAQVGIRTRVDQYREREREGRTRRVDHAEPGYTFLQRKAQLPTRRKKGKAAATYSRERYEKERISRGESVSDRHIVVDVDYDNVQDTAYPPVYREVKRGRTDRHIQERNRSRSDAGARSDSSTSIGTKAVKVSFSLMCAALGIDGESDDDLKIDEWGRPVARLPDNRHYKTDDFKLTHPENPYRVKVTKWVDRTPGVSDMPILQFWTMLKALRVLLHARIPGTGSDGCGLSRCWISDSANDWCGSVILNDNWIDVHGGEVVNFIALSDAKSFAKGESPEWNYFTPREQSESEWEIVYALLVVLNREKHVWERVGLAKIFKAAFTGDCWQEIMLG